MKIPSNRKAIETGSVLITCLIITFVLGFTLASYLVLSQHQTFAVARSQTWNHSITVAEAGVEDALQYINKYSYDTTKLTNWIYDTGVDGWTGANPTFSTKRYLTQNRREFYVVTITNRAAPLGPIITATGFVPYDFANYNPATTAVVGAPDLSTTPRFQRTLISRKVQVETVEDGLFGVAMLVDENIKLNGNTIATDSFDSTPGSPYNSGGMYDPNKRNDRGDIATNSGLMDAINSGNAKVRGHLRTGPGGSPSVGASGSVGSAAWVDAGNTGVEDGYSSDDMNMRIHPVFLPSVSYLPVSPDPQTINGVDYDYVFLSDGDYQINTKLSGSVFIGTNVNVRLYQSADVALTGGNDQIRISPGASLQLYMGGTSFDLSGSGLVNETGYAENFLYYGLASNTEITLSGNGGFTGAIYAPQADLTLGGGGKDVIDFVGAIVGKSITMNGHFNFHFDEALADGGPRRGYIPVRWTEL